MVIADKKSVVSKYFERQGGVKTANNSLSTSQKGKTLYSYNTPIAYYSEDEGKYYLNKNKYSTTTSSQQNIFRNEAKSRGKVYEEVDAQTLQAKVNAGD